MSYLKIGDRQLDGDQIIAALVQYKLLEPLVGQILVDDVIKDITLSQSELFYLLMGTTDSPIPDDVEAFVRQWCEHKGVTLEYFKAVMLREFRVQKFKQLQFAHQVESEFLRVKLDLDQVAYSLIQLTDLALAQELYFQLRDDAADFAQLAHHHSLGRERETGGRVGPMPLSAVPPEVELLFRNEPIGTVYGPIPVGDVFWIVRLEQLTAARLTAATRANLIDRLYQNWLQTQVRAMIHTPGAIAVQSDRPEASAVAA